jgi:hypothetical protein
VPQLSFNFRGKRRDAISPAKFRPRLLPLAIPRPPQGELLFLRTPIIHSVEHPCFMRRLLFHGGSNSSLTMDGLGALWMTGSY